MTCLYCDRDLASGDARAAYDPWLGRLWRVCPSCRRWNVVPMEDRWEAMESFEREARDRGRTVLRTEHLDLVQAEERQFIRVGRAPRPELAGWRYSDILPGPAPRGLLARLRAMLLGVPTNPFGYGAGYGGLMSDEAGQQRRWFASPFLEDAPTLTAAFIHVPFAERCASCAGPMALAPWAFQQVRLLTADGWPAVIAECGVCGAEAAVPLDDARPALRLGLSIVTRRHRQRPLVESAARSVDRSEGPAGVLHALTREEAALGDMAPFERLALAMALDEQAEAELLETEWRDAEELAALVDGELTHVEGFEEFRRRVLG